MESLLLKEQQKLAVINADKIDTTCLVKEVERLKREEQELTLLLQRKEIDAKSKEFTLTNLQASLKHE